MSLLPLLFDDIRPIRKNLVSSLLEPYLNEELGYLRNPRSGSGYELERPDKDTSIITNKDHFQASIDVQQFDPEDITVKLADNTVTVEGKHEERQDEHGYISRHFVRKYVLPEEYDTEKLQSKLSSDGVLNIIAPKKSDGKEKVYREIPIALTGPARSLGHKSPKKLKTKRLQKKGPHSIY